MMKPIGYVTKTIAAENTFSDALEMRKGNFSFTVSGLSDSTVHLQRSIDGGTTWVDVTPVNTDGWYPGNEVSHGTKYRFGIKTGGYGSDTVIGVISY